MKTQLQFARENIVTKEMEYVAKKEQISSRLIKDEVAAGKMIIPANVIHLQKGLNPIAIGRNVSCKVNANIGSSSINPSICDELQKLKTAIKYGTDTVMDLSTGGDISEIRKVIINESRIPIGTVPLYQALAKVDCIEDLSLEIFLETIWEQAQQGVDYFTIHCGLLQKLIPYALKRVTGIVSRGGSVMAKWMTFHNRENFLFEGIDEILSIMQRYDISMSLGDGLRPGSIADASDKAQFGELDVLGELVVKCQKAGVQVMVEGPGHIPFNEISMNVEKQMQICHEAPFYVLGPIVTDVAPGYDHITSAIGATAAAYAGASMLCYVTPKEHLGLPTAKDVREGLMAYRIAAHAADVALSRSGAKEWDLAMSRARFNFDWTEQYRLAMDPERAREYREETLFGTEYQKSEYCSMCGPKFCSMKITKSVGETIAN